MLGILFFLKFIPTSNQKPSVSINNRIFNVKIAKTNEERAKGLSIYDKLPVNEGMLFTFTKADYYTFWMKDMKFPIDIIYIKDDKIVYIFQNVLAPSSEFDRLPIYKPTKKANYVLEINAGLSKKYNFKVGNEVKINL